MNDVKNMSNKGKLNWFLNKYIYPEKMRLISLVFLIFVGTVTGNISPYLYGQMLDTISSGDIDYLVKLISVYFFVTIFTTLLSIYESYFGKIVDFIISKNVQKNLFDKMIRLRAKSYDCYDTGELMSRLNGDSDVIVSYCIDVITSFLHIFINIVISLYFVFKISTRLTTVAIFYIPASFVVTYFARKHFKELAGKKRKYNDRYYSFQNEVFSNHEGIKSYMLENSMSERFKDFVLREFQLLKRTVFLENTTTFLNDFIGVISTLYVIYMSAVLIKAGMLTIGTLVSFNVYINRLFSSVSQILSLNRSKQNVIVSLDRLMEVFSEEDEQRADLVPVENFDNISIEGNHIYFKYNKDDENILNNFSFKIDSPGFYSFVGKNGCGKSTFAKLLINLYDIEHGELKINGKDYKNIDYRTLRSNITYAQKEDFFFHESIIDNLKLEHSDISDEKIMEVCKKVELDDFINSLPKRYDTMIEEGGLNFSSGQRQKLSIARVLLRGGKVYIFDETTANLDGKSEKNIVSLLKEISMDSIVIFISHKLSSIIDSDEIFVIDNGGIIEKGSHKELMEKSLFYRELFEVME